MTTWFATVFLNVYVIFPYQPSVARIIKRQKGYNDMGRYSLSKRVYEFFLNDKRP